MKKRLFKVILITALVILVILLSIKILDLIHFRCLFKYLFNFYCAGCGTTRMIKSLIKLDFYQSFRYNPGVFILSIMLFIYLILYLSKSVNLIIALIRQGIHCQIISGRNF